MWKRILVLVLFLFGVFWWLTNRDQVPVETSSTEVTESATEAVVEEAAKEDEEEESAVEPVVTKVETKTITTPRVTTPEPVVAAPEIVEEVVEAVPAPAAPRVEPLPAVTTEVKVYLYEWGLDMSQKTFPAGTVNFTVQNDGRFTHDFSVRGVKDFGKVTPGTTANFSAGIRAGEYEVYSDRREDYDRGLVDTIVVE